MSTVTIISSMTANRGIGLNNELIVRSKEDLSYFKKKTMHKPLLMGRKTFDSLPGLLPGRHHSVITSNHELLKNKHMNPNLYYTNKCVKDYILDFKGLDDGRELCVIGGGDIFTQALDYCDKINLTVFNTQKEADTFFPLIPSSYTLVSKVKIDELTTRYFYSRIKYV